MTDAILRADPVYRAAQRTNQRSGSAFEVSKPPSMFRLIGRMLIDFFAVSTFFGVVIAFVVWRFG